MSKLDIGKIQIVSNLISTVFLSALSGLINMK